MGDGAQTKEEGILAMQPKLGQLLHSKMERVRGIESAISNSLLGIQPRCGDA
jgi:hypothetical protein